MSDLEIADEELEKIRQRKLQELLTHSRIKPQPVAEEAKPVQLTDSSFDEIVGRKELILVDFWAAWCAPCLRIAPAIEQLARKYAGRVTFGKLNVDENPATATRFGVMSIPTLLVFKQGRMVDQIVGAVPASLIESRLKRFL